MEGVCIMTLSFSQTINGKPNYFPEKIWIGLDPMITPDYYTYRDWHFDKFCKYWDGAWTETEETNFKPKLHTIRLDEKNRWGAGADIHFVINNRKPNRFQFAPVIKCVSVQNIEINYVNKCSDFPRVTIDGKVRYVFVKDDLIIMKQLAINDGFNSVEDFFAYFNKDFTGKIIHWTDLKY